MKFSRLLVTSLVISMWCCGCEEDTVKHDTENACEEDGTCADDQSTDPGNEDSGSTTPGDDSGSTTPGDDSGSTTPGDTCENACEASEKKCGDGAVMECVVNQETKCTEWAVSETCSEKTHCDETQLKCVEECSEVCDAQNSTKCGSDGVMTCTSDENGCAVWTTTEKCEGNTHCDETQLKCVKSCTDECDINAAAKCDGESVVTCKTSSTGCTVYQKTACTSGTYCDATSAACVSCKETCTATKRCSANGVETCSSDAHGCAVWTLTTTCKTGQSCDTTNFQCTDACNGKCTEYQVCNSGKCECDTTLPSGWPSSLTALSYPLMIPTSTSSMHGMDNIYAPDIHEVSGKHVMWYGGQGKDGHDRIFMAWSENGAEWRKYPSDDNPQPALDAGTSNHVNDPSLVQVGGVWKMYYTDAPVDINDRIWLAESNGLTGFKKVQEVLGPGPAGEWDSDKVGRPSILYEDGVYKMWYDGAKDGLRHVGLATSTDGINFTRHPANPLFLNSGAIDVKKVGGVYVMLRESQTGTFWATSTNGVCWVDRGRLFGLSGSSYDTYGQVTPFLEVSGGKLKAVWFGGASVSSWNRNRISAAYAPGAAPSGGGCTSCTMTGMTCTSACQNANAGNSGSCGNPGSTAAGACCVCANDGCEKCVVGAVDCNQACVNIGKSGGFCAHPGSTDSSKCCNCLD